MRKSIDAGATFGAEVTLGNLPNMGGNGFGDFTLEEVIRTHMYPSVAVNPVLGALYVAVGTASIRLWHSNNGGATWSEGRVDTGTLNLDTANFPFLPSIAVTPDGSRLFVSWYDRRRNPANRRLEYFGAIADLSKGAIAWTPNFRISSTSFPSVRGQDPLVDALGLWFLRYTSVLGATTLYPNTTEWELAGRVP